ncbi:MAG: 4-oxalocrotonate tautomerase [Gammaproteobacteria bacterium RIFCSPHIGHO2_12_FULL_63_22]|nr:MAG: 4-oxalocrotonate tautomerase [Gammaproteobacteria bacterium RIFCSPHIGHO2_12_FULL_63_22]
MPLVQIKGVAGYLSDDEKQTLIKRVTDAVVSVEGEALRQVTWVIVEDVASGAWGVGGEIVSTEGIRKMGGRA